MSANELAAAASAVAAARVASDDEEGGISPVLLWVAAGHAELVANFFQGKTEKERRTYIKPLKEFVRSIAWNAMGQENWRDFHERRQRVAPTLIPAALAVFSTPGAAAKFMRSLQRSQLFEPRELAAVRQVLADRAPAWLAELPAALADTLAPQGSFELIEAVSETAGVPMVPTRGMVRAWTMKHRWYNAEKAMADLLEDPLLPALLPLVFDDDENDDRFSSWCVFRDGAVAGVKRGLVSRADVLDASLRRLLRGGRTGAMQDHVAFWTALEPTDAEIVERVSSCISLLSSQNGTVARTFLAALKTVSDHGLLDLELAVEAASIAVTRSEKNIVKTTLSWLDKLASGHPSRVGELAGAIATAFGAQAADVQERAVKLVGKHGKALGEDERARLVAEGEIYLAPDLAATLAGLLGVSQPSMTDGDGGGFGAGAGYPDVAPYVPRPLLPPIASPAELAEVFASLMHADPVEAMVFERLLEAVVTFERTDSASLKEALAPIAERWKSGLDPRAGRPVALTPRLAVMSLAVAAAGIQTETRRLPHRAPVQQLWLRSRASGRSWYQRRRTTPADFLILRAAEVYAALGMPDLPPLLSVPTSPTGFVAPRVLAARLRECEALGVEPLAADLHQALLRLPADCGDVDVSGLTSPAGARFAAWVAGDRVELPDADIPEPAARELERTRSLAESARRAGRDHAVAPRTLLDLAPGVWREPERCMDGSDWMVCWSAIVPSRLDLAAMAMVGGVDWGTAPASADSAVALAEAVGAWEDGAWEDGSSPDMAREAGQDAAKDGVHRVIAARLVSDDLQLRASGVDAALILAARRLLDPPVLGTALAAEAKVLPTALRRSVPALRDLANGGAAGAVWEAIAVALPQVLPPAVPKTLSGTADLLVLATELAATTPPPRKPIAEVSTLVQKKGGSAVANAARRLEAVLAAE